MRQYAGFSTAADTNRRFKFLLEQGQTGLSTAFDLPTQMGYDPDSSAALGEVGRVGVPISSVDDMEILLADLPMGEITTSMTINATAAILVAFYVAVADSRGIPRDKLGGTVQNDILKEYIARGTYIYPTHASMRLVTDIFEFCGPGAAALEHDLDQWLSHARGRGDGGPGAGIHARERDRLRGCGAVTRSGRRRLCRSPLVLLRGMERALRGSGQVPRRAANVGADHEGALRCQGAEEHDVSLPRPDRRVEPDCAVGRQQRRADDDPGTLRSARRSPEPAHECAGRGARTADRSGGTPRATDAADHRLRKWRRRHGRSARRAATTWRS